jgi:hypothetical protein
LIDLTTDGLALSNCKAMIPVLQQDTISWERKYLMKAELR